MKEEEDPSFVRSQLSLILNKAEIHRMMGMATGL